MEKYQIRISIAQQSLTLMNEGEVVRTYSVSTAKNGAGEQMGSECTPRGAHLIHAKIGAGCEHGTVFVGRIPTGQIYKNGPVAEPRDLILCRILWLCGTEPGRNRLGKVDSMSRYIYIHGCPDSSPMGIPLSHGCIRMRNAEIAEMFELVQVGTEVDIEE